MSGDAIQLRADQELVVCPFCKEQIHAGAQKCKHCGEFLNVPQKSNVLAAFLGFFLGPVGLWYKRRWAAGFAWLVMALLLGVATSGLIAPFFWIGMTVHAAVATPRR